MRLCLPCGHWCGPAAASGNGGYVSGDSEGFSGFDLLLSDLYPGCCRRPHYYGLRFLCQRSVWFSSFGAAADCRPMIDEFPWILSVFDRWFSKLCCKGRPVPCPTNRKIHFFSSRRRSDRINCSFARLPANKPSLSSSASSWIWCPSIRTSSLMISSSSPSLLVSIRRQENSRAFGTLSSLVLL